MPHNHFKKVCTCGTVISQCRCMSKDKTILTEKNGCSKCREASKKQRPLGSARTSCSVATVKAGHVDGEEIVMLFYCPRCLHNSVMAGAKFCADCGVNIEFSLPE